MRNPARKKYRPLFSAFVDGELSPQQRMHIERHLAACPESAQEVADMRALSTLMRTTLEEAAQEEAWEGFADRLMGQLAPERLPWRQRLGVWLSEVFTYRRGWVAAGALAVPACIGIFMWASPAEPVGYASPHLAIKTVSAKGGTALKTMVTHTETGDAIIWVVEETPTEEAEEAKAPSEEEAPPRVWEFNKTPNKAGAL